MTTKASMKCGRSKCDNTGIWLLHPTESWFNGDRFRCEDHLRGALVDRYNVINGIEYIGPEVAAAYLTIGGGV